MSFCREKKRHLFLVRFVILFSFSVPISAAEIPGDIAEPYGQVDLADLLKLSEWWLVGICDSFFDNCMGADMSGPEGTPDGIVNYHDFAMLAAHWLEGVE